MASVPGWWGITKRICDLNAADDQCWRVHTCRPDGYAQYGRPPVLVHRIAWAVHHRRKIPVGHDVHHACLTRNCVNPAHLELLTEAEHRALHHPPTSGTPPVGSCRNGHEWASNAKLNTQGRWICLSCQREAGRRYDAHKRGKVPS